MMYTFQVHGIKIFENKFFGEAKGLPFFKGSFQDIIPPVGLQNGDIIVFLVLADLIRQFHSLSEQGKQFIIHLVDLFS